MEKLDLDHGKTLDDYHDLDHPLAPEMEQALETMQALQQLDPGLARWLLQRAAEDVHG